METVIADKELFVFKRTFKDNEIIVVINNFDNEK